MITLKEFKAMSGEDKCSLVNRVLEQRGKKEFKGEDIGFSWSSAEKALKEDGIYEIDGKYRTAAQSIEFLNAKAEKEKELVLTQENIASLLELLEPNRFEMLMKLTEKYNYVSNYILREDMGIKIRRYDGVVKNMTMRVSDDVRVRWKKFVESNSPYSGAELLNTALIEFMERHGG